MKIKSVKQTNPLSITLETQEEIDQLFAILNFSPIASAINLEKNNWGDLRNELNSCKTSDYNIWHDKLENELGR